MLERHRSGHIRRAGYSRNLFEAQATATPERPAVSFEGRVTRYGELNRWANGVAHALKALGVGRGSLVGLSAGRSLPLLAALIGIQKSGGAYVPLDPNFPAERLAFMLVDSGAKVLVTTGDLASRIEVPDGVAILDLDTLPETGSPDNPRVRRGPSDIAYVIYTSGSTGRPKGVAVPHGAVVNFLCSMLRKPGLSATDIMAAVTTISFDIAVLELYLPLLVGARIELVPRETATDGAALALLRDERRQHAAGDARDMAPADRGRLARRTGFRALCGGEPLPRDLADAILDRVDELWNLYGPTETTVWSTRRIGSSATAPRSASAGRSPTPQIHILDRAGEPVPIGVAGEIHIGGLGVATRLSSAPGAHGGALRSRPLLRPPGRPSLPDRRSRPLGRGRQALPSRPARPPGEDPRLSHRTRRGRGGARRQPGGAAGGRDRRARSSPAI